MWGESRRESISVSSRAADQGRTLGRGTIAVDEVDAIGSSAGVVFAFGDERSIVTGGVGVLVSVAAGSDSFGETEESRRRVLGAFPFPFAGADRFAGNLGVEIVTFFLPLVVTMGVTENR